MKSNEKSKLLSLKEDNKDELFCLLSELIKINSENFVTGFDNIKKKMACMMKN